MLGKVCGIYLSEELLISVGSVGKISNQHYIHHNSQGPYISRLASILGLLDYFRSHIARRPAKDFNLHKPINTLVFFSMQVLKPKSMSLGEHESSRMMFSSLMSRWAIFLLWIYLRASAIFFIIDLQSP